MSASRPINEGEVCNARIVELELDPVRGTFDAAHLQEIHRRIFQDFPHHNPGKYRPDARGHVKEHRLEANRAVSYPVHYALRPEVDTRLDRVLSELRGGDALKGLTPLEFAGAMAKAYGDLDYLHPFSEGNSRTLRSFTKQLAEHVGHYLDWSATNADAVTRDNLYMARDIEVLHRAFPDIEAVKLSDDGPRPLIQARMSLNMIDGADRLQEIVRQSVDRGPASIAGPHRLPIGEAEAELSALLPAARRQAESIATRLATASYRNRSLEPAYKHATARKAALDGEHGPEKLFSALQRRGDADLIFERVPGAKALDRVLAYREGMERQLAQQHKEIHNGPPRETSESQAHGPELDAEVFDVRGRHAEEFSGSQHERSSAQGGSVQGLLTLGRGSTLAGLADKVPAGRSIPDGAEQVVVMNGSRLHERRHEGKWEVQKSDPQGMLPKGVFRLDTAAPAKADDGAMYAGSILHVSARGVYQVHGNGVARHEPAAFQQVPKIGDSPKVVYAKGRATITGRDPQSQVQEQGQGRSR